MESRTFVCACIAATALTLPHQADAQTTTKPSDREQALEARLDKLEAEVTRLRADLAAARAQGASAVATAQAASAQSSETATKVAEVEKRPPPEGMRVGNTTIKIGGWVKMTATFNRLSGGELPVASLGRDFDLPQTIPIGGARASTVQEFSAKQTRLWVKLATDIGRHTLKGYVEGDFQAAPGTQGTQRTTNAYGFALRRAYLQFDRWMIGQDWSTFQNAAVLPESTDYIGATAGTVFARHPQIRYTAPLGKGFTMAVAAENAEAGTAFIGNPALVENGDDNLPDFTARVNYQAKAGELALAGVARKLTVQNGPIKKSQFGWGVSGSGRVFLDATRGADVRFMVSYGRDIGRYVGLNFAPDVLVDPVTGDLSRVNIFAAFAALHFPVVGNARINLIGDFQGVDYPGGLTSAQIGAFNRRTYSGAANMFLTPIKGVDLGLEYRHRVRDLENGASGASDRIEFAGKYSF